MNEVTEIMLNANLMQQGNFIDVFLAQLEGCLTVHLPHEIM